MTKTDATVHGSNSLSARFLNENTKGKNNFLVLLFISIIY